MGARKHINAEERKKQNRTKYFALLNNCPTSPRKMRLVADQIRNKDVGIAMEILKHSPKEASGRLLKLVKSAIANWENKNDRSIQESDKLFVKEIFVDSARMLKRIRPAPQGRAHRIRKRSNHVTVFLASRLPETAEIEEVDNIENNEEL